MRRLFVPICFGLLIALGVPSVQAGNQEEANRIAQRLTQQYPQYNIEVAYQEGTVRLRGDNARNGRFSRSGRAVKDHIGNLTRFDDAAKHPVRAENMLLSDHIVQRRGAQLICKRSVHFAPPI